jgi:hypothetical protein
MVPYSALLNSRMNSHTLAALVDSRESAIIWKFLPTIKSKLSDSGLVKLTSQTAEIHVRFEVAGYG